LDESGTSLALAFKKESSKDLIRYLQSVDKVASELKEGRDYVVERSGIKLSEKIEDKVKERYLKDFKEELWKGHEVIRQDIITSLRARISYEKGVHYLVDKEKGESLWDRLFSVFKLKEIIVIDETTGRLKYKTRLRHNLHTAIEVKEGVEPAGDINGSEIATPIFFKQYGKLAAMSGTMATPIAQKEMQKLYGGLGRNFSTVIIPTHRPMVRNDLPDKVFLTKADKYKAVIRKIMELNKKGEPVLVATVSVSDSELLSRMLKERAPKIKYQLLNAKKEAEEIKIVKTAGKRRAVTIATNMAGRGTDIKLDKKVILLGGFFVIGTELNESPRLDMQLRGRAGRQGNPGASQFYLSLEDKIFGNAGKVWKDNLTSEQGLKLNADNSISPDDARYPKLLGFVKAVQEKTERSAYQHRVIQFMLDFIFYRQQQIVSYYYWSHRKQLKHYDLRDQFSSYRQRREEYLRERYQEIFSEDGYKEFKKWSTSEFNEVSQGVGLKEPDIEKWNSYLEGIDKLEKELFEEDIFDVDIVLSPGHFPTIHFQRQPGFFSLVILAVILPAFLKPEAYFGSWVLSHPLLSIVAVLAGLLLVIGGYTLFKIMLYQKLYKESVKKADAIAAIAFLAEIERLKSDNLIMKLLKLIRRIFSFDYSSMHSSSDEYGEEAFSCCKNTVSDEHFWTEVYFNSEGRFIIKTARDFVENKIKDLLPKGGNVLDVMCGAQSLMSQKIPGIKFHGIGVVKAALQANAILDTYEVRDINNNPNIKSNKKFDMAIISLGVPYMTKPLETLRAINRFLKPGGAVLIFCSTNLYASYKATHIWRDPSKYGFSNHVELVKDYLTKAGGFRIEIPMNEQQISEKTRGFVMLGIKDNGKRVRSFRKLLPAMLTFGLLGVMPEPGGKREEDNALPLQPRILQARPVAGENGEEDFDITEPIRRHYQQLYREYLAIANVSPVDKLFPTPEHIINVVYDFEVWQILRLDLDKIWVYGSILNKPEEWFKKRFGMSCKQVFDAFASELLQLFVDIGAQPPAVMRQKELKLKRVSDMVMELRVAIAKIDSEKNPHAVVFQEEDSWIWVVSLALMGDLKAWEDDNPSHGKWIYTHPNQQDAVSKMKKLLPYFANGALKMAKFHVHTQETKAGESFTVVYSLTSEDPGLKDLLIRELGVEPVWRDNTITFQDDDLYRKFGRLEGKEIDSGLLQELHTRYTPEVMTNMLSNNHLMEHIGISPYQAGILIQLAQFDETQRDKLSLIYRYQLYQIFRLYKDPLDKLRYMLFQAETIDKAGEEYKVFQDDTIRATISSLANTALAGLAKLPVQLIHIEDPKVLERLKGLVKFEPAFEREMNTGKHLIVITYDKNYGSNPYEPVLLAGSLLQNLRLSIQAMDLGCRTSRIDFTPLYGLIEIPSAHKIAALVAVSRNPVNNKELSNIFNNKPSSVDDRNKLLEAIRATSIPVSFRTQFGRPLELDRPLLEKLFFASDITPQPLLRGPFSSHHLLVDIKSGKVFLTVLDNLVLNNPSLERTFLQHIKDNFPEGVSIMGVLWATPDIKEEEWLEVGAVIQSLKLKGRLLGGAPVWSTNIDEAGLRGMLGIREGATIIGVYGLGIAQDTRDLALPPLVNAFIGKFNVPISLPQREPVGVTEEPAPASQKTPGSDDPTLKLREDLYRLYQHRLLSDAKVIESWNKVGISLDPLYLERKLDELKEAGEREKEEFLNLIEEQLKYAKARDSMVKELEDYKDIGIKDKRVLSVMKNIPRDEFIPENLRDFPYIIDKPIHVSKEQTISHPYLVAVMTQAMELEEGERVLEVGTGSGYRAAVLAKMVGNKGEVCTVERNNTLQDKAKELLDKLGYKNIKYKKGVDGYDGWEEEGPYDAIVVNAGCDHYPRPLIEQLKVGGRMVILIGTNPEKLALVVLKKREALKMAASGFEKQVLGETNFVHLVGKATGFTDVWRTCFLMGIKLAIELNYGITKDGRIIFMKDKQEIFDTTDLSPPELLMKFFIFHTANTPKLLPMPLAPKLLPQPKIPTENIDTNPSPTTDKETAIRLVIARNRQVIESFFSNLAAMKDKKIKIGFLCKGNAVRSVFMHLVLQYILHKQGMQSWVEVRSAGTESITDPKWSKGYYEVMEFAKNSGISEDIINSFRRQQVSAEFINEADIIFAADLWQLSFIEEHYPNALSKTALFKLLSPDFSLTKADWNEIMIIDIGYFLGLEGYRTTFMEIVEIIVKGLRPRLMAAQKQRGGQSGTTGIGLDKELEYAKQRDSMVDRLKAEIKDDEVLSVMKIVPRHEFIPKEFGEFAYIDRPVPIDKGQTISQPYIVAIMTQSLELRKGDNVLEIGTGSGYQTAILSKIVGGKGKIYTIERIKSLQDEAKDILSRLGCDNIEYVVGDGYEGWKENGPYDAITVTCAPDHYPPALIEQLKIGGRMVLPVGIKLEDLALVVLTKTERGIQRRVLGGVRFVPMVGKGQGFTTAIRTCRLLGVDFSQIAYLAYVITEDGKISFDKNKKQIIDATEFSPLELFHTLFTLLTPKSLPMPKLSFEQVQAQAFHAEPNILNSDVDVEYLNGLKRRMPALLEGVDLDENAETIIGRMLMQFYAQDKPALTSEQAKQYKGLLRDYFAQEVLVAGFMSETEQGKWEVLYRLLFGPLQGILLSEKEIRRVYGLAPDYTYTSPAHQLLDSKEFVLINLDILENPSWKETVALVILKPEAKGIENIVAINYPDPGFIQLIMHSANFGRYLPKQLTRQYIQGELLSLKGLNEVREQLARLGFSKNKAYYPPFELPRAIMIPEGIGPEFIEKIVIEPRMYIFIKQTIEREYKGQQRIGSRDWQELVVSWDEYKNDPRLQKVKQVKEAIIKFTQSFSKGPTITDEPGQPGRGFYGDGDFHNDPLGLSLNLGRPMRESYWHPQEENCLSFSKRMNGFSNEKGDVGYSSGQRARSEKRPKGKGPKQISPPPVDKAIAQQGQVVSREERLLNTQKEYERQILSEVNEGLKTGALRCGMLGLLRWPAGVSYKEIEDLILFCLVEEVLIRIGNVNAITIEKFLESINEKIGKSSKKLPDVLELLVDLRGKDYQEALRYLLKSSLEEIATFPILSALLEAQGENISKAIHIKRIKTDVWDGILKIRPEIILEFYEQNKNLRNLIFKLSEMTRELISALEYEQLKKRLDEENQEKNTEAAKNKKEQEEVAKLTEEPKAELTPLPIQPKFSKTVQKLAEAWGLKVKEVQDAWDWIVSGKERAKTFEMDQAEMLLFLSAILAAIFPERIPALSAYRFWKQKFSQKFIRIVSPGSWDIGLRLLADKMQGRILFDKANRAYRYHWKDNSCLLEFFSEDEIAMLREWGKEVRIIRERQIKQEAEKKAVKEEKLRVEKGAGKVKEEARKAEIKAKEPKEKPRKAEREEVMGIIPYADEEIAILKAIAQTIEGISNELNLGLKFVESRMRSIIIKSRKRYANETFAEVFNLDTESFQKAFLAAREEYSKPVKSALLSKEYPEAIAELAVREKDPEKSAQGLLQKQQDFIKEGYPPDLALILVMMHKDPKELTRTQTQRSLLIAVHQNPDLNQKEIAEITNINIAIVHKELNALQSKELIKIVKIGQMTRAFLWSNVPEIILSPVQEKILKVVKENPAGLNLTEIVDKTKIPINTVERNTGILKSKGLIQTLMLEGRWTAYPVGSKYIEIAKKEIERLSKIQEMKKSWVKFIQYGEFKNKDIRILPITDDVDANCNIDIGQYTQDGKTYSIFIHIKDVLPGTRIQIRQEEFDRDYGWLFRAYRLDERGLVVGRAIDTYYINKKIKTRPLAPIDPAAQTYIDYILKNVNIHGERIYPRPFISEVKKRGIIHIGSIFTGKKPKFRQVRISLANFPKGAQVLIMPVQDRDYGLLFEAYELDKQTTKKKSEQPIGIFRINEKVNKYFKVFDPVIQALLDSILENTNLSGEKIKPRPIKEKTNSSGCVVLGLPYKEGKRRATIFIARGIQKTYVWIIPVGTNPEHGWIYKVYAEDEQGKPGKLIKTLRVNKARKNLFEGIEHNIPFVQNEEASSLIQGLEMAPQTLQDKIISCIEELGGRASVIEIARGLSLTEQVISRSIKEMNFPSINEDRVKKGKLPIKLLHQKKKIAQDRIIAALEQLCGKATLKQIAKEIGIERLAGYRYRWRLLHALEEMGLTLINAWRKLQGKEALEISAEVTLPVAPDNSRQQMIQYFLGESKLPLERAAADLEADGKETVYTLKNKPVRLFVARGIVPGRIMREVRSFGKDAYGVTYWFYDGQKEIFPIVGYTLFKAGEFLKKPIRHPFGKTDLSKRFSATARSLPGQHLIYYLLAGKEAPELVEVTLDAEGIDFLYNLKGKSLRLSLGIHRRHLKVLREIKEFAPGERGVIYWYLEGKQKQFPLMSFILFRNGKFVTNPLAFRYHYDWRSISEADIPGTRKLSMSHLIAFLGTGLYPPLETTPQIDTNGAEMLYTLHRRRIFLWVGTQYVGRNDVKRRSVIFQDGSRGVLYVQLILGQAEFPIISYKLFKNGEFLDKPIAYLYHLQFTDGTDVPTTRKPENQRLIYYLATGQRMPGEERITVGANGNEVIFSLRQKPISLFIGEQFANDQVIRQAVEFTPGVRGVTYWKLDAEGQPQQRIVDFVLFEEGRFLDAPLSTRYILGTGLSKQRELPFSYKQEGKELIRFLATAEEKPVDTRIHLMKNGNDFLYGWAGEDITVHVFSPLSDEQVLREAVDFGSGQRGVRYWFTEGDKKLFPLRSAILFENNQFLKKPRTYAFDLREWLPEDIPGSQRNPNRHLIYFLATGKCRPEMTQPAVDKRGAEHLYQFREQRIYTFTTSLVPQHQLLREARDFGGNRRGVVYWYAIGGVPVFPLVSYVLFEAGKFVEEPKQSPFDWVDDIPAHLPGTLDLQKQQLIYFLATGKVKPEDVPVMLLSRGEDNLFNRGRHSIRAFVGIHAANKPVIRRAIDYGSGRRGIVYLQRSGKKLVPLVSYVLFKDGAFVEEIERERHLYNLVDLPPEGIPQSSDPEIIQMILYLITGKNPPQLVHPAHSPVMQDYLYGFGAKQISLYVPFSLEREQVLREFREFGKGIRGVTYWYAESDKPLFPLISYRLFEDGRFLEPPSQYKHSYDWLDMHIKDIPNTNDFLTYQLIYFLKTGKAKPLSLIKRKVYGSGEISIYTLKGQNLRLLAGYPYRNQEIGIEGFESQSDKRGIYLWQLKDGKPSRLIKKYILFQDGQFLLKPEREPEELIQEIAPGLVLTRTQEKILKAVIEDPGLTQREIVERTGLSANTVTANIKILLSMNLVESREVGSRKEIYPKGKAPAPKSILTPAQKKILKELEKAKLLQEDPGLTVAELASRIGLFKGTVSRNLRVLKSMGRVESRLIRLLRARYIKVYLKGEAPKKPTLTLMQNRILKVLYEEGPLIQKAIIRGGISRAAISVNTRKLKKIGLVKTQKVAGKKRDIEVSLTKKVKKIIKDFSKRDGIGTIGELIKKIIPELFLTPAQEKILNTVKG
ncbi:MAG: protein-L-isoaspartate(D-aspartate) O-methyltransferase, partial [Candidatus Omnitrophota bacterium]|nr:protein-L-isoaspartate(D-aspartate) O-methyltransferase [Candidatus Omnitrophota bacterium]